VSRSNCAPFNRVSKTLKKNTKSHFSLQNLIHFKEQQFTVLELIIWNNSFHLVTLWKSTCPKLFLEYVFAFKVFFFSTFHHILFNLHLQSKNRTLRTLDSLSIHTRPMGILPRTLDFKADSFFDCKRFFCLETQKILIPLLAQP